MSGDVWVRFRNRVLKVSYVYMLKPLFFRADPEMVHDCMLGVGVMLGRSAFGRWIVRTLFGYEHPTLSQSIGQIEFKNPIGLSAGFDKNAELTDILPSVGFGFGEVGSITGERSEGNAQPRLWRLKKSESLLVYYGLKNDGAETIATCLSGKHFNIPIGVSVAATNRPENLDISHAVADFAKAFRLMEPIGDYITVNVSCPNAQGGQSFLIPENLDELFNTLDGIKTDKLIFVKLSPDQSTADIDALLEVIGRHRIHGIICANLTKQRENKHIHDDNIPSVGGMSGKVVRDLSDDLLSHIYTRTGRKYILVGCGGVFTAEDAYKKIRLGASLVQLITGMVFQGPQTISEINVGLVKLLERDGFQNISDAVGTGV